MAEQEIGTEVARKLSLGELGMNKLEITKLVLSNTNDKHFLARFLGSASGVKPYKDADGEVKFGLQGEFEGTSVDGVVLGGTVLYLPGFVNDSVVAVLSDEEVGSVRIGYDIYAQYDEKSATSYTFSARDLINAGSAKVAEVKAQIAALPMPAKTAALAAPKK